MNKILLEKDMYLKIDEDTSFQINNDLILTLEIDNNKELNIDINISKNIKAIVNMFNIDTSINININLDESSTIDFINSSINHNNLKIIENINHKSSSTSIITNHGINVLDGNMDFIINAIVNKDISNANLKQDNKIINYNDGRSKIEPNLLIDSFDCYATHSAYISKFNNEELFYLMSRGISLDESIRLLTKSFLLGKMELKEIEKSNFIDKIYNI